MPSSTAFRRRWLARDALHWRDADAALGYTLAPDVPITTPRRRVGVACRLDGLPLVLHPACVDCGQLAGPRHVLRQLPDGRSCGRC